MRNFVFKSSQTGLGEMNSLLLTAKEFFMRILITGGAGFIGSHLAEACLKRGDEVYIIDDLSTGSLENIKAIRSDERYKDRIFVHIDTIMNQNLMLELVGICDIVFHLAAAVGVRYILDNPLKSIKVNVEGTEKVLELCARFKKKGAHSVIIGSLWQTSARAFGGNRQYHLRPHQQIPLELRCLQTHG